jgi:uncharacterized protein YpmS
MTPWRWVLLVLIAALFLAAVVGGTLLLSSGHGDPNMGPIGLP